MNLLGFITSKVPEYESGKAARAVLLNPPFRENRLNAAEIRKETYNFKIPKDARDRVSFTATLKYLPYPSFFAERLGLPKPKPVEIAASTTDIILN